MAGGFSDGGRDTAVKAVCGVSPSANRWLALCTTAPDHATLGTELTAVGTNGYARQPVTFASPVTSGSAEECRNNAVLLFGPVTSGALGTVTHVMLMDDATASTVAHMLAWAALDNARTPGLNDMIRFDVGQLAWNVS